MTPVELGVVKEWSSQHHLALRLCARVAASRGVEVSYDLADDLLLKSIKFPLKTAIAAPILDDAKRVEFVLLFFSSRLEQVWLSVAVCGRVCGAVTLCVCSSASLWRCVRACARACMRSDAAMLAMTSVCSGVESAGAECGT